MRFLIDENVSPRVAALLGRAGHDAVHVSALGLRSAPDEDVLEAAVTTRRILVSADTDFGMLLARTRAIRPSMLLIRRAAGRRADEQAKLILDNIDLVETDLSDGAIVVLGERTLRIRRLPIGG